MELLMGIDVGTTTIKCMIFDVDGKILASASTEYPTYYPKPEWAEQNAEDWWEGVVKVVRECLRRVEPKDIVGISVSSQREGVVLIDEEGRPLDRVIIWMDRRSRPQAEWINKNFDVKEIYRRTGLIVDPTWTATKLLWIRENKPELLEKCKYMLQAKDYVVYKLTGEITTDHSIAYRTMLYDINKWAWWDEFFEELKLPREKFPEPRYSDEVVGFVTNEAARVTGLRPGTPVVGGGGDRSCEILGSGCIVPQIIEESTGTGSTTATTIERPIFDEKMRVLVGTHVMRGRWSIEVGMSTAGAILRWFRDQLCFPEKLAAAIMRRRAYELMDMQVEYIPPGSHGLIILPFFMGARAPRWMPYARGVIFGLMLFHTRAHIARAIMEAVAYEIRKILEVLEELGLRVKEIRALGGGGKTPLWCRIKADVTGKRVVVPEVLDAACLGDAILAGVGTGLFKGYEEAVRRMVKVKWSFDPSEENMKVYDKLYRIYNDLIEALKPLFPKMAEFMEIPIEVPKWDVEKLIHLLYKLEA
ncbi:MAG: xylulokinase [Thermoprotei archaeon]|nr:MAG: xylulokinase [Thermoprotei archaeon]